MSWLLGLQHPELLEPLLRNELEELVAGIQTASRVQGREVDVPFLASNFTGSAQMAWTVTADDQLNFSWVLNGKRLTVNFTLSTTTVGGVRTANLQILIPAGLLARRVTAEEFSYNDNGTYGIGVMSVTAAGNQITLQKTDPTVVWAAATNASGVKGVFEFEVI